MAFVWTRMSSYRLCSSLTWPPFLSALRQWRRSFVGCRAKVGTISLPTFPFFPMYLNGQGSTARKLEPDRFRAGVRADGALGVATALAQAGSGRGSGLYPSTVERRCSAAVAPPPPSPHGRVRGAAKACRGRVKL
eukprot:3418170-Prymnesium_polylepis.1